MGLARDRQTVILAGAGCEAGARRWRRGAGVVLVCVGGGEERSGRDGAAGMEQGGGGGAVRSGACGAAGHGATLEVFKRLYSYTLEWELDSHGIETHPRRTQGFMGKKSTLSSTKELTQIKFTIRNQY
ncbi:Protein of unknown function [Gryllus bimaculatus]|nr:Protein of unknown function [Gryllus bimaculatus]